ncbi:hypothetical protein BBJ28_00000531 [Nothophytophthora sp. Chile5]|nr:hypothetical protein BBJ28_00000531 [Nothophytophthora sp. Chile5]
MRRAKPRLPRLLPRATSSAACFQYTGVSAAEIQAQDTDPLDASAALEATEPALSHFNGLHTLSGASYRAFKNRLKRLLRNESCLRYHTAGSWWHYEWCLDRHVRQYHPLPASTSPSGTQQQEDSVLLGIYDTDKPQPLRVVAVENLARLADPDRMGYVAQQSYGSGAFCEARGAHRSVRVQFKCCAFHANETYVDALEERAPCDYELSVCSPVACGIMQRDQFVLTAPTHMEEDERAAMTLTVRDMFYHAYNGYLTHAFPQDDLLPLSCRGGEFELGRLPMLTLIDTLDTLAVLEDAPEFRRAVALIIEHSDFDLDTEVSLFEITIRVLGGLLSAHLFAVDEKLQMFPQGTYDNELLRLAVDLGDRLMPAFDTATGIPYGTVNLRRGVPKGETPIASTAGAGSLSLEFTMLSVLTGDAKYAAAARGSVRALFQRRSKLGLLGKHINTKTGDWTETASGPGSNADSFYEYLLKMYALFGDRESLEMFAQVYPAVLAHNKHGDWYTDVSMFTGCHHHSGSSSVVFESLAAFWPGMQAGVGDLSAAAQSMNAFYRVWRDYGFLSEQFNVGDWKPVKSRGGGGARYPLRPELVESTFYMHEATNDSSWLRAGAHVVHSLQKYAKTPCGYASIGNIETKEQEDYMPSFFLSETCKYLYLLFNTTHFFRKGNYVMTTEAHPLPILPTKLVEPILRAADAYRESDGDDTRDAIKVSSNRFAPERVMWCEAPRFYDAVTYSVHYESKVMMRTPWCSPSVSSPRPSTGKSANPSAKKLDESSSAVDKVKTATVAVDTEGVAADVLQQWLPAIEEKLRKLSQKSQESLLKDGSVTEIIGDGATSNDASREWLKNLLQTNERRSLGKTQQQSREQQIAEGHAVQFLYGGHQLGEFRVEQLPGRLRVTREETGDWIEVSSIVDDSHMVVSMGYSVGIEVNADADSYTYVEPKSESYAEEDDRPPQVAWNHVYKIDEGLAFPSDQRCALQVQVALKSSAEGALPSEEEQLRFDLKSKATTWLSVPCVGAGFGIADVFQGSRAFPAAELVVAEPFDACTALTNGPEGDLRGKMVLAHRGECYFETKARNAAARGAAGVIIVNNEDDDLVMVMGGIGEDEDEDEDEGVAMGQQLSVPVVMVPHRLGAWFEARIAEAQASSRPHVRVGMEFSVRHHEREGDGTRRRSRRVPGQSEFPRVEGTINNMKVYGPVWGVELIAATQPTVDEGQEQEDGDYSYESFSVAILGTPPWQH